MNQIKTSRYTLNYVHYIPPLPGQIFFNYEDHLKLLNRRRKVHIFTGSKGVVVLYRGRKLQLKSESVGDAVRKVNKFGIKHYESV